jgi:hypothetical protein
MEPFCVEPDVESVPNQTLVQFVDNVPVHVCVDKKNLCISL